MIGEISPVKSIDDLETFAVGDSIFMSYYERVQSQKTEQRTFWILPDGKIQNVKIPELKGKRLCAINPEGTRFYYYEIERKAAVIKCIAYDHVSAERQVLPGQIDIPGRILGTYFDENLNLIWVARKGYMFEMVTIRDLQVVKARTFPFASDLANGRQTVSFINNENCVRPEMASSDIKIIKRPDEIFVISDEHDRAGDYEGKTNRTIVARIDLITEKVTTRTYSSPFKKSFCTTMFKGYVLRSVSSEGLEVYDFETNTLVNKMPYDKEYSGVSVYKRDGTKKTTKLSIIKKYPVDGNFITADSTEGKNVILTLGHYWLDKPSMIVSPSSMPLLSLLVGVTTGINSALAEGTLIVSYTYFKGDIKSQFLPTSDVPLVRKVIDDYEIQQQATGIKYKFKAYSVIGNLTYAFYLGANKDSLQIIKFAAKH
jgi:hypothetical protein